ncbi:MAG: anaerobic ribonucleoside-triphosphate reductase activating protein [Caldimicrobium sp.]
MIKGFRGTSLVDYPGKIASVIYLCGCNFRCPFCYNIELLLPEYYRELPDYTEEEVIDLLEKRKNFIQGIVISGGEPTIWGKKLFFLVEKIKYHLSLPIKLDTNGSNPELLEKLLNEGLIDFIAMDFKTSPKKYELLGGNFSAIQSSLNLLQAFPEKVEIRITLYPPLVDDKDFEDMLTYLKGFKFIALQKYLPEKNLSGEAVKPYTIEEYEKFYLKGTSSLPDVIWIKRF